MGALYPAASVFVMHVALTIGHDRCAKWMCPQKARSTLCAARSGSRSPMSLQGAMAPPEYIWRWPKTRTHGVTVRSTAARSAATNVCWRDPALELISVCSIRKWTGPWSNEYQPSSAEPVGPARRRPTCPGAKSTVACKALREDPTQGAVFGGAQVGMGKRACVGTPHSPPESPSPMVLPDPGKSRSWLPIPVIYGTVELSGSICSMKRSHSDSYPVAYARSPGCKMRSIPGPP
mmetsp:Transcript_45166/g.118529  ORF Transcript_45166/g.118529 Transcript_45166/m.118529 type:complete len:234 (+) Transcript_45166:862-1563(+)